MALLEVKDIHKKFGDLTVLDGVDLSVDKGDVVSVLGPSGSGKTSPAPAKQRSFDVSTSSSARTKGR